MIRRVGKYLNYDDKKFAYRLVLKGKHIGYFKTIEEAIRQRAVHCIKQNIPVPTDTPTDVSHASQAS